MLEGYQGHKNYNIRRQEMWVLGTFAEKAQSGIRAAERLSSSFVADHGLKITDDVLTLASHIQQLLARIMLISRLRLIANSVNKNSCYSSQKESDRMISAGIPYGLVVGPETLLAKRVSVPVCETCVFWAWKHTETPKPLSQEYTLNYNRNPNKI